MTLPGAIPRRDGALCRSPYSTSIPNGTPRAWVDRETAVPVLRLRCVLGGCQGGSGARARPPCGSPMWPGDVLCSAPSRRLI